MAFSKPYPEIPADIEIFRILFESNLILYKIIGIYYNLLYRRLSIKLGFSIPINCIDAGLSIAHYGTIVIFPHVKIGKNCRIHACVNIGASSGKLKAPKIGDNVYIGPGALLFGEIEIANRITIGANSTVNKSCLTENAIIADSPAIIVKINYPDWTEFNNRIKTS